MSSERPSASATVYHIPQSLDTSRIRDVPPSTEIGPPPYGVVSTRIEHFLGQAAPTFSMTIKTDQQGGRAAPIPAIDLFEEDDWIDISLQRWDTKFAALRGQIENVHRVDRPGNSQTVTIMGRGFGRVFEMTSSFLELFPDPSIHSFAGSRPYTLVDNGNRSPTSFVEAILSSYLVGVPDLLGHTVGGTNQWILPPAVELLGEAINDTNFLRMIYYFDKEAVNWPPRRSDYSSLFAGQDARIWSTAQYWSDEMLGELYTDLLMQGKSDPVLSKDNGPGALVGFQSSFPKATYPRYRIGSDFSDEDRDAVAGFPVEQAVCGVVYRDRPFPSFGRKALLDGASGKFWQDEPINLGPWFTKLRRFTVDSEDIHMVSTQRDGNERRNAFYIDASAQASTQGSLRRFHPTWDQESIKAHGIRRFRGLQRYDVSVEDKYPGSQNSENDNWLSGTRGRLRDFYCLNHRFLNGTITLKRLRPDIRIGHKVAVLRPGQPDETYYIEGVVHDVTASGKTISGSTVLHVTRGVQGTDQDFIDLLARETSKYATPNDSQTSAERRTQQQVQNQSYNLGSDAPTDPNQSGVPGDWKNNPDLFRPLTHPVWQTAALEAGVPTDWVSLASPYGKAMSALLGKESGGYVGRPNYLYGDNNKQSLADWQAIWADLRAGILRNPLGVPTGKMSSATGLGQLLSSNANLLYPGGLDGIGKDFPEAVGMLKYIKVRYGNPIAAYAYHQGSTAAAAVVAPFTDDLSLEIDSPVHNTY